MIEPIFRARECPDFVVDRNHSVLLNTNQSKLEAYKLERKRLQEASLNNNRINKLENELSEIKQLLRELINGNQ